ncbi:MAG TPA: sulfatase-like hydrolase/transferase [Tepidisphaeraceae bacterium]|jgi:arylsulfatase A-like enzyme|nr:sulfatase-like hydrolase/transferase [Tepidisphaeraceae bacterium]
MKLFQTIIIRAAVGVTAIFWGVEVSLAADRPNIVLLMADDLGYGDLAYTGNPTVQTPELDRMAREGMRLSRFYAGAPVCTPTRASVMTGRNAFRSGTYWAGRYPLPEAEITIGEIAHEAGYRTGFFGKWHLGKLTRDGSEVFAGEKAAPKEFAPPWRQGFDVCFAAEYSVPTYNPAVWDFEWRSVPEGKDKKYVMDRPLAYGEGTLVGKPMVRWPATFWREGEKPSGRVIAGDSSAMVADEAVKFIDESAKSKQPFLAVIWFFTPHSPSAAGNEDRALYPSVSMREQHWFGAITALDRQVGRVRAELAQLGIADNTFVHFCSDNGPSWIHDLGSSGPYRGRKGELHEGGIHVPGIVEWPGHLQGGSVLGVPMSTDDLLPTIAALTGAEAPKDRPLDGQNVLPILEGQAKERSKPLVFRSVLRQNPVGWEAGEAKQSAVIDGPWKLVSMDNDKTFALYDLDKDPQERTDLAAKEGERVKKMKEVLAGRIASFAASARGEDYHLDKEALPKIISPQGD